MEPFNLHHPNVEIIWNFYPFNWFILPPLSWTLNIIILPVTLLTWPLWEGWNLLNLFWAILFFPAWLVGFTIYSTLLILGWLVLFLLTLIPIIILLTVSIFVSLQTGNWIFALFGVVLLALLTLATLAIVWFALFGVPVSIIVGVVIWATVPCITEDAALECAKER